MKCLLLGIFVMATVSGLSVGCKQKDSESLGKSDASGSDSALSDDDNATDGAKKEDDSRSISTYDIATDQGVSNGLYRILASVGTSGLTSLQANFCYKYLAGRGRRLTGAADATELRFNIKELGDDGVRGVVLFLSSHLQTLADWRDSPEEDQLPGYSQGRADAADAALGLWQVMLGRHLGQVEYLNYPHGSANSNYFNYP